MSAPTVDLERAVRSVIVRELGAEEGELQPSARFDALGADSLDMVELVVALEREFEIEFHDDEAERLVTVGDALRLVAGKVRS